MDQNIASACFEKLFLVLDGTIHINSGTGVHAGCRGMKLA
jgi:hypothetical protein